MARALVALLLASSIPSTAAGQVAVTTEVARSLSLGNSQASRTDFAARLRCERLGACASKARLTRKGGGPATLKRKSLSHGEGASSNPEMRSIFDADQKDRQDLKAIDWATVGRDDEKRRLRTQAMLRSGRLNTSEDLYRAAFVFQHGTTADDFLTAHVLAIAAVAKGNPDAVWIAAATLDRFLQHVGKPQVLGTQFRTDSDRRTTQEPYNRVLVPDSIRQMLAVPVAAKQEEQRISYESAARSQPARVQIKPLQSIAPSEPARVFSSALRPANCQKISGSDNILGRPTLRWIVLGEMHGTAEAPNAFGDLVCLASLSKPVNVAIEQSASDQAAINEYIGSDGGLEAKLRFLRSGMWNNPMKDGRSSEAYLRLFERLRELRTTGQVSSVVAFQPIYTPGPTGFSQSDYENALAATLITKSPRDNLTLVLVGNIHAMRASPAWAQPSYLPMAGYLPTDTTVSLDTRWNGGSYWACTTEKDCGPKIVAPPAVEDVRQITMNLPGETFTGVFRLGVPITASPPQRQVLP